jgi:uncharacterized membrane protein YhaH (DUF805 family)
MSMPGIVERRLTRRSLAGHDPRIPPPDPGDPMRTRPASLATIVIALGLALTSIGLARSLPYTVGGAGSPATVGADLWAHGTGLSPALVALVVTGLLAAIAMRPTHGGRRASGWLAVLAGALLVAGLAEPAQRDAILFGANDLVRSAFVIAYHVGLIALVLSTVGEARAGDRESGPVATDEDAAGGRVTLLAGAAA